MKLMIDDSLCHGPAARRTRLPWPAVGILCLLAGAVAVRAQPSAWNSPPGGNTQSAAAVPEALEGVSFEQRLGEQLPLDAIVRNEEGREVALAEYFGEKPAILALVYYECPMLCTLELNGLLKSARVLALEAGRDFDIIALSFDPGETPEMAAEKKQQYVRQYGREGAERGWHFLTADAESIERVTEAAGFRYRYDPETDLYSHASGIMLLTREGTLSRYFYGVDYSPRDLRLGLVEASENRIGTLVDQVLLFCFHYDPRQGEYTLVIMNLLRLAATLTLAALAAFLWVALRRERRQRRLAV